MPENVFGVPVRYEAWDKQSQIPLYIAGGYDFRTAYILNVRCIMLKPKEMLVTLPALKKQIAKIQEIDPAPIVLETKAVSSFRRKSLIENNIPFITDKQVFLPFVGTLLCDEKAPEPKTEKFVFSSQQLLLFYLYSRKSRLYISEAAKILPFTAMTLTRAVKQLEGTDLFSVTKDGVNKVIEARQTRAALFEKAKPYLQSPVRKTGYMEKSQLTSDMVYAGETALADKTMLNPGKVMTYAVSEKDFDKKLLSQELIDPKKQVRLELWAYSPKLFSNDACADVLSVALSFADHPDERIEEAVEEMLEGELKDNG